MKITAVKRIFSRNNIYAKVITDEGIYGLGEGTLNSREAAVAAVLEQIEKVVVGSDPFDIEHIWQDILRGTFWRGGPVLMSALSALDAALWDIKGKALNTPVYNLLGGKCRDKIRVYSHCNGNTPDELCRNAENVLKRGITVLRICPHDVRDTAYFEPGRQVRTSIKFMKALRQSVGDDIEIIFEGHTRFTPARAIELANGIAEYHPVFFEDPMRSDSPENFRVLREHTNVALATGEKFGPLWDYKTLIEEDLIDYLRTDICNCGGITAFRKIAAYGEAHYMEMVPHGLPSAVGLMAVFHADLATPNFFMQESGLFGSPGEHLTMDAEFKDGFFYVGNAPGLGIDIDESKCQPYSTYEHPHWRREDGTVQDW
jgi:L-alanine-DL-glutamate epimerase-like enolase superfamily enzyme